MAIYFKVEKADYSVFDDIRDFILHNEPHILVNDVYDKDNQTAHFWVSKVSETFLGFLLEYQITLKDMLMG